MESYKKAWGTAQIALPRTGFFRTREPRPAKAWSLRKIRRIRKRGCVIGENCLISKKAVFGKEPYLIQIGDSVRIEAGVRLVTHDLSAWTIQQMGGMGNAEVYGPISIGDNTFIGAGSVIMPGISIGRDCVVLENSVVMENLPNGTVAAGVPARQVDNIEAFARKCWGKCTTDIHKLSPKQKRRTLMREFNLDI